MKNAVLTQTGSFIGSILLVSGCCIGAGMLGMPLLTASFGFVPACILLILSWVFMVATGLLVLEANIRFKGDVNLLTMAEATLGKVGKSICSLLFLFLFYSLLVAYVSGCGVLVTDFLSTLLERDVPGYIGSLSSTVVLGLWICRGTHSVDLLNRVLIGGLIASYLFIVTFGSLYVDPERLAHHQWSRSFFAVPVMLIAFGFHNLIPSLSTYLNKNVNKMRTIIILGSAIPLLVYVAWEAVFLGLLPLEMLEGNSDGAFITHFLSAALASPYIPVAVNSFAFFAIATSLIANAISCVDFLSEGCGIKKDRLGRAILCVPVLAPPTFFALLSPTLFLNALHYAGGFGTVLLFGVMPALMVWIGRYRQKVQTERMLPGGKPVLGGIIAISFAVMALECFIQFIQTKGGD